VKTVSVTSIIDYRKCPKFYQYRYVDKLRVPPNANMVSGSVVHGVIEYVLSKDRSLWGTLENIAEVLMFKEFAHRDDARTQVTKYLPGVLRALSKVPEWVWERTWHVEELMEWTYRDPNCPACLGAPPVTGGAVHTAHCNAVTVRMKPDLWLVEDGVLDIVEFKTTENDPLDYLLFNAQHQFYAIGLMKEHPDMLVRFRYVCLPTTTKKAEDHIPWVFTTNAIAAAREELVQGAVDVGSKMYMNRGFWCKGCEFKGLCMTVLTGGDERGMMEEMKEVMP